jgi:hypothetical protein
LDLIAILKNIVLIGSAGGVLAGFLIGIYKVIRALEEMKKSGEERKAENVLLIHGVLAALKGLEYQGCNGPVTEARKKLEDYVIEH